MWGVLRYVDRPAQADAEPEPEPEPEPYEPDPYGDPDSD